MRNTLRFILAICGLALTCGAESQYYVQKSAKKLPEPLRKLNSSGIKALGKERYEEAVGIYSKFIQRAPKLALGYANRGTAYMHLRRFEPAYSDYEKAVDLDPSLRKMIDPSEPLLRLGMGKIERGDLDGAESLLSTATAKDPGNAFAWNELAFISAQKRDYARCLERASKALAIRPDYAEALSNRGGCYSAGSYFQKALRDLDMAISIKPEKAEPYLTRGGVHAAQKRCAAARADISKAVSLDPSLVGSAALFLGGCPAQ